MISYNLCFQNSKVNYIICFNNKIIQRGTTDYYSDFKNFIPIEYKYTWTYKSDNLILINVVPRIQPKIESVQTSKTKSIAPINTWNRDKFSCYKMETG